jgi:hypothetical protein
MRRTTKTATLTPWFGRVFKCLGLALSFCCLCLSACAGPKPAASSPPKLYTLHGTVLSLSIAPINGEKIPGWVDAMTMDYPVKDAKDWRAVRPNEVISTTIGARDTDYTIRDVKPAENSTGAVPK